MNKKRIFYSEWAYVLGMLSLAMGATCMTRADFGLSMVVAPAYLLHLKLSQTLPFFSFGTAEYCLQAFLLILIALVVTRRAKPQYLLSLGSAVFYGLTLDLLLKLTSSVPVDTLPARLTAFFVGMTFCAVGVSLLFHTYLAPEAYELFVKEFSRTYGTDINKTKTVYDCVSCAVAVVMSFAFFGFGHFEGVKLGTIFCALVNGSLIGACSRWLESNFDFRDGVALRRYFE